MKMILGACCPWECTDRGAAECQQPPAPAAAKDICAYCGADTTGERGGFGGFDCGHCGCN